MARLASTDSSLPPHGAAAHPHPVNESITAAKMVMPFLAFSSVVVIPFLPSTSLAKGLIKQAAAAALKLVGFALQPWRRHAPSGIQHLSAAWGTGMGAQVPSVVVGSGGKRGHTCFRRLRPEPTHPSY